MAPVNPWGDELRDDVAAGGGEVQVSGPRDDDQAPVGEVVYERLVHSSVGRVVQGVLVDGHEPLDVVGDITDGQAHHLLDRVRAVGPAGLLQASAAIQLQTD